MCFSARTCRWNSTCLLSCLFFSEWKVFRRERTTSPHWTIYCPSLGIPHDPGMGMDSGKGRSGELTLAVLSRLSDKTESAALKLNVRVFSKEHFSSFSLSDSWWKKKKSLARPIKVYRAWSLFWRLHFKAETHLRRNKTLSYNFINQNLLLSICSVKRTSVGVQVFE